MQNNLKVYMTDLLSENSHENVGNEDYWEKYLIARYSNL